jgi:hypothetical protein
MIKFQTFQQRQSSNEAEAKWLPQMMSEAFNQHLSSIVLKRDTKNRNKALKIRIARIEAKMPLKEEDMQDYLEEYNAEQLNKVPLFSKREMQMKKVA